MYFQHITVSGELGSGKSSIAHELARIHGMNVVSTGALQRKLAESLGLSTLAMNKRAETDSSIDERFDGLLREFGSKSDPAIFDSRMAWHFVPDAFKIHLVVDSLVAAERLYRVRSSDVESYSSVEHAARDARKRFESERMRFQQKYSVDIGRLKNYDLIVDTSDANLAEVVAEILQALDGKPARGGNLRVSPRRIVPTIDPVRELAAVEHGAMPTWESPTVGYSSPYFFAIRGHDALSKALLEKKKLVSAILESEDDEEVVGGITASQYLFREAQRKWIYDWEDIHGFRFSSYPDTADKEL